MASLQPSFPYKVYVDPNPSDTVLVDYKGSSDVQEVTGYYCPYIPLGIAGVTPVPQRITIEGRDNQGGWWDGVAVLLINDRHILSNSQMEDIHVWCVENWGAPQVASMNGRWMKDRELIFVHDSRMLVELKLHWHGVELR